MHRAQSWDELLAKPPFQIILETHDHIWAEDWPLGVRVKATQAVWDVVCFPDTGEQVHDANEAFGNWVKKFADII